MGLLKRDWWHPEVPFAPKKFPFFYGWFLVFAATVGVIASIPGQTMGVGVFTDVLIENFNLTRQQVSLAYLIGTLASGLVLPHAGRLLDRWGMRKGAFLAAFFWECLFCISVRPIIWRGHWGKF